MHCFLVFFKEQSIVVLKFYSVKINRQAIVEFVCLNGALLHKIVRKNLQKYLHCKYIFGKLRNVIFENYNYTTQQNPSDSYQSTPFMTTPTSKILNNVSKLVCVSQIFVSGIEKQFIPALGSKFCIVFLLL